MTLNFGNLWEVALLIIAISIAFITWKLISLISDLKVTLYTLNSVLRKKDEELSTTLEHINSVTQNVNDITNEVKKVTSDIADLSANLRLVSSTLRHGLHALQQKLLEDSDKIEGKNSEIGGETGG